MGTKPNTLQTPHLWDFFVLTLGAYPDPGAILLPERI